MFLDVFLRGNCPAYSAFEPSLRQSTMLQSKNFIGRKSGASWVIIDVDLVCSRGPLAWINLKLSSFMII